MERATILAGFGGQGLLFGGEVMAHAAMARGHDVLWIPSYGPEMRGGTASCTVLCSDHPIGSPVVDRYQAAALLNQPSADRFLPRVAAGGIAVVDDQLVGPVTAPDGVRLLRVPCSALARVGGEERMTSIVAIGALAASIPEIDPQGVLAALLRVIDERHPGLREGNRQAFIAGMEAAAEAERRSGPGGAWQVPRPADRSPQPARSTRSSPA